MANPAVREAYLAGKAYNNDSVWDEVEAHAHDAYADLDEYCAFTDGWYSRDDGYYDPAYLEEED